MREKKRFLKRQEKELLGLKKYDKLIDIYGKNLHFNSGKGNLKKVKKLAERISKDYEEKELHLILVLKGAFVLRADLIRFLKISVKIHFLKSSNYRKKKSTGRVKIIFFAQEIKGKNILIIRDIVNITLTLREIIVFLKKFKLAEIKVCSLFR